MPGDAHYSTVVLRLPFDGADGATTDVDKANSPATLTFQSGAKLSTTRQKFGASSLFLDGTNDNLNTNRSCAIGTGQFTADGWVRCTGAQTGRIISNQSSGSPNAFFALRVESDGSLRFLLRASTGGTLVDIQSAASLVTQNDTTWHHVAVTRNGSNRIDIWLDGTSVANGTSSISPNGSGVGYNLGSQYASTEYFKGYIDDFRLNEGYCYYTGTFTPPTEASPTSDEYAATGFLATNFGTPQAVFNQSGAATGFLSINFGTPQATSSQIGVASGFLATNFGSPRLVTLIGVATGWLATNFGTPRNIPNAVGWLATHFGTAKARYTLAVTGFSTVNFGTPRQVMIRRVTSLGKVTHFGTPTTPIDLTVVVSGWLATNVGHPVAMRFTDGTLARNVRPVSWRTTTFGTPTADASDTGAATGWLATVFGAPASNQSRRAIASGLNAIAIFGTPTCLQPVLASGFRSVNFGTPRAGYILPVSSFGPATHFGTPSYRRSGSRLGRGWFATRFGRATALQRNNHPATGFFATHFGTPSGLNQGGRTTSLTPTRFGTPQAVRNPRC